MSNREKILAGSKKIGETICGKKITGLGKIWQSRIDDNDPSIYGSQLLGREGEYTNWQYAYVEGE